MKVFLFHLQCCYLYHSVLMGSFLFAKMMGLENNIYFADRIDYVDWSACQDRYLAD